MTSCFYKESLSKVLKMKVKSYHFLSCILFYLLLLPLAANLASNRIHIYPYISSSDNGVSNYEITQSVKYQVEINFSLAHKSGIGNYFFIFARLNNRVPSSNLTKYTPPYQESKLLYNKIIGCKPSDISMGLNDRFNNIYDSFFISIPPFITPLFYPEVSLSQKYVIELNAIAFQEIDKSEIGSYEITDEIFELYCNRAEPYYEREDPSLITLSNSIVSPDDNPIEKAEKIYEWVSDNLNYKGNLPPQEKGALWAYNNLEGDCSEYSSLMITLLRIQGIPARKVTGFLLSNNPSIRPKTGDTWNFHASETSSNILGHAWVEYYIPNIGWIACDPTWNRESSYFNRVDYLRFNLNVGANFFVLPFKPFSVVSEFSNPLFSYTLGAEYEYDYSVKISVIESNITPIESVPLLIFIFIALGIFSVVAVIIVTRKKRSNKQF
jgi:transglutaminase-like putative cysteine protease